MELEGLRVIAAIVVVLYHAALIFYPGYFYGVGTPWAPVQNMFLEDNLYQNPLSGLLSGTFAVGIFFVLSGFVLSIGFFQKKDINIIKKLAAKRYFRLMLPALASVLIAWFIIATGLADTMAQTVAITQSGWLGRLWTFPPDFISAIHQGLIGVFVNGQVNYNPVLWTIRHEFIGSFIIFGSLLLFASSRHRWVVYAILLFAFSTSWLLGFITGMILADIYVNRQDVYRKLNSKYTYLAIAAGVVLAGYPAGVVTSFIYKSLQVDWLQGTTQYQSFYTAVGATILVAGILSLPRLKSFFAHPKISGFSKYTYSLYLIHMPVLFTVCTGSFVLFITKFGFHTSSVLAIATMLVALIGATYLFEKYIDAPSIKFSSYCTDIYLGKRDLKLNLISTWIWFKNVKSMLMPQREVEVSDIFPEAE